MRKALILIAMAASLALGACTNKGGGPGLRQIPGHQPTTTITQAPIQIAPENPAPECQLHDALGLAQVPATCLAQ